QIRNDVATLLGFVNDFAANNNGAIPTAVCYEPATGNVGMVSSGSSCTGSSTNTVGKLGGGLTVAMATSKPSDNNTLNVALKRKCNGNTIAGTETGRAVAVGFKVETAGTPQDQCTES